MVAHHTHQGPVYLYHRIISEHVKSCTHFISKDSVVCSLKSALHSQGEGSSFHCMKSREEKPLWLSSVLGGSAQNGRVHSTLSQSAWDSSRKSQCFPGIMGIVRQGWPHGVTAWAAWDKAK